MLFTVLNQVLYIAYTSLDEKSLDQLSCISVKSNEESAGIRKTLLARFASLDPRKKKTGILKGGLCSLQIVILKLT